MEESGDNVSRTGRQRKKSAKVLEMEAEADELEEVLRARVDASQAKNMAANLKAAKAKWQAKRALAKAVKAEIKTEPGEVLGPPHVSPEPSTTDNPAPAETVSKSGRVRKKSAKLLEMVEVEEMEKKIFRSSDIPKSMRTPAIHSPPSTPAKKMKLQTSPCRSSTVSTPSGSIVTSQGGSTIQLLLTSPVKKSPGGPGSPPPEPILLTLGASLNTPSKVQHMGTVAGSPVLSQAMAGSAPVLTAATAAPVQPTPTSPPGILKKTIPVANMSPSDAKAKDFEVKFLADCPDVVLPPKPVKRKSKKQANPTPSAPALSLDITKATTPPKTSSAKAKKSPTAAVMADQPLLAKMMGEVGHANIGPPPPSSAEAKSMKKKAMKQAKEAAKMAETMVHSQIWVDPGKKKVKDHLQIEQKVMAPPMPVLQPVKSEPMGLSFVGDDEDEDEPDHLMIDTSSTKSAKKKAKKEKKEKSPKAKISKAKLKEQLIQARIQSELILKQELERAAAEESQSQEEDGSQEEEDEELEGVLPLPELPSYANTNEMANKLLTSSEKKASKEKKKKKGAGNSKEDPEKQKKKRGPTAYMLYCNAQRAKLVTDNPGIDFATISRRLGEMWQGQSEKEKMSWKKKAKKLASKGSTVINTGKGTSKMLHGGPSSSAKAAPASGSGSAGAKSGGQHHPKAPQGAGQAQRVAQETEAGPSHAKAVAGITPLDVAAHLKLLGESLSIIGARLQEHHGQIAVQGTLPVLLDSLLCALGPLTCLTSSVQELNGAALDTHTSTLDNVAYIMPGIG